MIEFIGEEPALQAARRPGGRKREARAKAMTEAYMGNYIHNYANAAKLFNGSHLYKSQMF